MSDPYVLYGSMARWREYMVKNNYISLVSDADKPETSVYYAKVIGQESELTVFTDWLADNMIDPSIRVVRTKTRKSPRILLYFNSEDFAVLLKLRWDCQDELKTQ